MGNGNNQGKTEVTRVKRRFPAGAEALPDGGVHFRVWAPAARRVHLVHFTSTNPATGREERYELTPESDGYFSAHLPDAAPGWLYKFQLDSSVERYPDPASRFQPAGPHGPSEVTSPHAFRWNDASWCGRGREGHVIYEMHIGTFTSEGTWTAAEAQLPELHKLGITTLEVMPIADFPGRFGWGYDGVCQYAPMRLYGRPDDFRSFVNAAHQLGMGVILDVVYNHFGPSGNYLKHFSKDYFTDRYKNEWGEPINFDGPNAQPVRDFFSANAAYWMAEYHLDGLRLDATQQIYDASSEHILGVITREARAAAAPREIFIVAENEPQEVKLVRPTNQGGYGIDALWNDDYHHSAMVALTGRNEAYYTDYNGNPQEFISMVKYGYLYQGQRYSWQKQRRGKPALDIVPSAFVNCLENHDQVANYHASARLNTQSDPGKFRAITALTLLVPGTPMLFQGQEFSSSVPFYYFADHEPDLAEMVFNGRKEFLRQFPSIYLAINEVPNPADIETFRQSKLNFAERTSHARAYALHVDLLNLRRTDAVFSKPTLRGVDGAVLSEEAFLLRFFGDGGDDRLLIVNLGRNLHLDPAPELLLAPPEGRVWDLLWSSEDPRYGGTATPPVETDEGWKIPGHTTVVMQPGQPQASNSSNP